MAEFVLFKPDIHSDDYYQLVLEHRLNTAERVKTNHQIDMVAYLGMPILEYVRNEFKTIANLKPPDDVVYMLIIEGKVAGMGRISRLRGDAGEIKEMFLRPQYRGKGYGKQTLSKLLETGRELGFSSFLLDVWKLELAARHIYKSAGFEEIERYPANKLPSILRPHHVYMEKKEGTYPPPISHTLDGL